MDNDIKSTLDILSNIGLGKEEEEDSFGLPNEGNKNPPEAETAEVNPNEGNKNPPEAETAEVPSTPNPSAVGVVAGTTHVLIQSNNAHEPLRQGSLLFITETKAPLGHVEKIIGNGQYIVRLDSLAVENTKGMHVSLGSSENIEEDKKAESMRGKRKMEEPPSSRKKPHDSAPVSAAFSTGSSICGRGGQQNINHSLPQFPGVSEEDVNWYTERIFCRRPAVNQSSVNQQQHFGWPHAPLWPELNPNANPNQQQMHSQTQSQGYNAGQSFHQGGAIRPGGPLESAVYQNYFDQLHYLQNTAPRPEAFTSQVFPHPNQQMHLQQTQSGQSFHHGGRGRGLQMQPQFHQGGRGRGPHLQPQFHQGVRGRGQRMQPQFHRGRGRGFDVGRGQDQHKPK